MPNELHLPSNTLPKFQHDVRRQQSGNGHRYVVDGIPCERCAGCRKNEPCKGMPGCTSIIWPYKTQNMYVAGYNAAFNAVFGAYADKNKTSVQDGGWLTDFLRTESNTATNAAFDTIKDELLKYRQEAEEIPTPGDISRDFGTRVHKAMEQLFDAQQIGEETFLDDAIYQPTHQIVEWLDKKEYTVIDWEVTVYHPKLLYAGTIDCVAERNGNITLLDWKTGGLYTDAQVQLAGYALAYEEITGIAPTNVVVLRSNNTIFEAKESSDLDIAKTAFRYLVGIKSQWDQLGWNDA